MSAAIAKYYDNVNPTVLQELAPDAGRICEFGCGAGALARAVRQRNAAVHYVGVELMEDALAHAGTALDVALLRNLDRAGDWAADPEMAAALPLESFDHVVFGDVLEHLYEPERVLKQAADRLRPGGSAVLCIPNVQHWTVFLQLLRGSWPQQDSGLFDRTHIRWFALADMKKLLGNAGLVLEKVVSRPARYADPGVQKIAESFLEQLQILAGKIGVDAPHLRQQGLALQYVLVGRKPA
jgi:SAM-dependent methyltransferase